MTPRHRISRLALESSKHVDVIEAPDASLMRNKDGIFRTPTQHVQTHSIQPLNPASTHPPPPPMLKSFSRTSYRLTHRPPSHIRLRAPNLSRPPTAPFHSSSKMEAKKVDEYKKTGNRRDAVPPHEMVVFKGLMSEKRAFGDFRTVLHTGLYSQLVAMEVPVGGEIGDEVHMVDQILLFTSGKGLATVAGKNQDVSAGDVVVVPAGTQHQFVTRGDQPLELVTVYSPAEHHPTTVHKTKDEGDALEEAGKDEPPAWTRTSMKVNEEKGLVRESGKYE